MEISLDGPVGQVYALVVINDMLFAGTQVIYFSSIGNVFGFPNHSIVYTYFNAKKIKYNLSKKVSHGGHPASLSLLT
jgi:hypothetical protein